MFCEKKLNKATTELLLFHLQLRDNWLNIHVNTSLIFYCVYIVIQATYSAVLIAGVPGYAPCDVCSDRAGRYPPA